MKLKSILVVCLFLFWSLVQAQVKVPEKIIGNWIDEQDNTWEYGFYENFAVYNSDFWEYEAIKAKKNKLEIKLKKGLQRENIRLTLSKKNNGTLTIARNQQKGTKYKLNRLGYSPYPTPDNTPFKNSGFHPDTVTIIGYYRNLDQYLNQAESKWQKGPLTISFDDFIQGKQVEYQTNFDSLGRFKIKFPVLNTQQVFLDWHRLNKLVVVEPGETIFLYADLVDFIPKENITGQAGWDAFRSRPKQVVYMGNQARLHNELANYQEPVSYFNREETAKKITSDMQYLAAANSNFKSRLRHLEVYIKNNPTLSDRFIKFQLASEKYQLADHLMQYRFDKMMKKEFTFEKGYIEFIQKNMDFNDDKLFTLARDYSTFIRDYVDYHIDATKLYKDEETGELRHKGFSVNDGNVLASMKGQIVFTMQEEETITKFAALQTRLLSQMQKIKGPTKGMELTKQEQKLYKDFSAIVKRLNIEKDLPELQSQLLTKKRMEAKIQVIDSLFQNKSLKELLVARELYGHIEHDQVPLSADALNKLEEKVTIPPIKTLVLDKHNYYVKLDNQKVAYQASIKNTSHITENKNADLLFKQLVEPYKGKVIYVDFWGTWCGPCKEQMPFVGEIKKAFTGQEVVFMYLANNSPEKSWINVIKQMNLTGDNVVHYRLPDEQQRLIEKRLVVESFPTYLLIGKDGAIVKGTVPRPAMKTELISAINKLLKD